MKFFAFIFSVYILILTGMPCVDQPENYSRQKLLLAQTCDDHHANDIDMCSPFCTCECCVTLVIQQNSLPNFEHFTVLLNSFTDHYTSVFPSGYSNAVWQPPQLS